MSDHIRVLVLANEGVGPHILHDALAGATDAMVVAPALNTRLRHWLSDEDAARADAAERLAGWISALEAAGLEAGGWVGDADPLQAIEDALAVFEADGIVIATHPEERRNWLARDLLGRARGRFALPVLALVDDNARARKPASARPRRRLVAPLGGP